MAPLGSFSFKSLDGVETKMSYAIDSEGCLVRTTEVVQTGSFVDAKTDKLNLSAQCPAAPALKQLDYYKLMPKASLSGDSIDSLKDKIVKANPAKTQVEKAEEKKAAEQAAYASSQGGGSGDY
mmetsp:Transcript_1281/g.2727  ORF Transcript_1281/g.2727 Transcript_1281/m.2727 type:complete len:123 (+) Transcript_1281:87-455(+)|eukprot:CAMPEP_0172618010 /NCGR_PEP_ID=MMETSP1068-20121228/76020_1 /TAXON_ID=35684 /ORGANISM="Pseudopedinella elastica, Strain CCMP716" /LENGTH=122 /DNA_ID=CAMNT_0013424011 /DNA_START=47 /DNA_END=415 /DNA_ORIENTATION=-